MCQVVWATGLPNLWKADPSTHPDGYYKFFYRLVIYNRNDASEHKVSLTERLVLWMRLYFAILTNRGRTF